MSGPVLHISHRYSSDAVQVFEQIIPYLTPDQMSTVFVEVTARSTRDDERAVVCSAAAKALLSAGYVNEARTMLRAALRANPGREMRSRLFAELGWLEYESGVYSASVDAYDGALKINDQFPAAWAGRARALACMGKYDEARVAAGYAVVQNPSNGSYQHLRAALETASESPVDPATDLLFVLPEPGYLQAAAARYSVKKTNSCPPSVWDVSNVEDVLPMRF